MFILNVLETEEIHNVSGEFKQAESILNDELCEASAFPYPFHLRKSLDIKV